MRGPRIIRKWRRRRQCIAKYGKGNCPHVERHSAGSPAADSAEPWTLPPGANHSPVNTQAPSHRRGGDGR